MSPNESVPENNEIQHLLETCWVATARTSVHARFTRTDMFYFHGTCRPRPAIVTVAIISGNHKCAWYVSITQVWTAN